MNCSAPHFFRGASQLSSDFARIAISAADEQDLKGRFACDLEASIPMTGATITSETAAVCFAVTGNGDVTQVWTTERTASDCFPRSVE
jgi:hypothetical protein